MKCDKDRLSTWVRYQEGMCHNCWGSCCTMPVEVKLSDLARLQLITEDESQTPSPKKIARKLMKEGIIKNYRQNSNLFMLVQKANDDCVFLDSKTRLCTKYELRPDVCRKFPEIGPRPGWCPKKVK